jgi:hypothetical protein
MAKLYKLIVLFVLLTSMSFIVRAQVSSNNAVLSSKTVVSQDVSFTNYPNPAKSQTTVAYNLNARAKVTLKVIDLAGKQLALLISQEQNAGKQEYYWDFSKYKITSGMYILMLQIDQKTYSRKVIVQ